MLTENSVLSAFFSYLVEYTLQLDERFTPTSF